MCASLRSSLSPSLLLGCLLPCLLALAACDGGEGPRRPDSGLPDSGLPDGGGGDGGGGDAGEGCAPLVVEAVAGGLTDPVQLISPPGDDRLFALELSTGRIRILRGGSFLAEPFLDLSGSLTVAGDQGLLGLAFHPSYAANGRFFVAYASSRANVRISSFTVSGSDPDLGDAASETTLLEIPTPEPAHTSGHLVFGPDGYLYIGVGDGQADGDLMGLAQDPGSLLGKILRVDVDASGAGAYGIPADNPFVGVAGAREEVWALGFRLPYRFSFDPESGDLFIGEVGDTRFEEVDYEASGSAGGLDFGWPQIEGESACHTPSSGCDPTAFTAPLHQFQHGGGLCAMMGGFVYRGSALDACHAGRYYYADFCTGRIFSFRVEAGAAVDVQEGPTVPGNVMSWGRGGDGELYLLDMDGNVHRLANGR